MLKPDFADTKIKMSGVPQPSIRDLLKTYCVTHFPGSNCEGFIEEYLTGLEQAMTEQPDVTQLVKEPGYFYAQNDNGAIWRVAHTTVEQDILAYQARLDDGKLEQHPDDRYTAPVSFEDMENWLGDNINDMGDVWEIVFAPKADPEDDFLHLFEVKDGETLVPLPF